MSGPFEIGVNKIHLIDFSARASVPKFKLQIEHNASQLSHPKLEPPQLLQKQQ